jgi:excisionase family DNA binding protein
MEVIVTSEEHLRQIIRECLADFNSTPVPQLHPEAKYVYSIKELAEELQCSVTKAQQLKNSGKIPYIQFGRKCIFSISDVLKALAQDSANPGSPNKRKNFMK